MKVYLAPLENITTLVYRNTIHEMFGDSIDAYYMPFMMPHIKIGLDEKDQRELSHEKNLASNLVPQILTDDAEDFWRMAKGMVEMGYKEININIGCPSHKVASKGRGSGLLKYKEKMDRFLDDVFEENEKRNNAIDGNGVEISVKTRIGREVPEEFYDILDIYNKYPIKELTIHPRTGIQRYGGLPLKEYFFYALKHSKNPVCYNGNIYTVKDYQELMTMSEKVIGADAINGRMPGIMLGRGLLANPALGREIKGGEKVKGHELQAFMDLFRDNCRKTPRLGGEQKLLDKSKEIWTFMRVLYPEQEMAVRQILLCQTLERYLKLEKDFFQKLDEGIYIGK